MFQVIQNLGAADIDTRLEEQLIDGILFAFQEQVIRTNYGRGKSSIGNTNFMVEAYWNGIEKNRFSRRSAYPVRPSRPPYFVAQTKCSDTLYCVYFRV